MPFPRSYSRPLAGLTQINFDGIRLRLVDAKEQVVGRLASEVAKILQGKDKPTFDPGHDTGDVCVVINAAHVALTGRKWEKKIYSWHSGYPGGLKRRTAQEMYQQDTTSLIRTAVWGMLPRNTLRKDRMLKLRIFPLEEHPFQDFELAPFTPPPRKLRDRHIGFAMPSGFEPLNQDAHRIRLRSSRLAPYTDRPSLEFHDLLSIEEVQFLRQQQ